MLDGVGLLCRQPFAKALGLCHSGKREKAVAPTVTAIPLWQLLDATVHYSHSLRRDNAKALEDSAMTKDFPGGGQFSKWQRR